MDPFSGIACSPIVIKMALVGLKRFIHPTRKVRMAEDQCSCERMTLRRRVMSLRLFSVDWNIQKTTRISCNGHPWIIPRKPAGSALHQNSIRRVFIDHYQKSTGPQKIMEKWWNGNGLGIPLAQNLRLCTERLPRISRKAGKFH